MKIAQIVCTFPPYQGGIGNSVYNLSRSLAALGREITVFTPDYGYPGKPTLVDANFRLERLKPLFKFGNAAWLPQLLWELRGYDIIHLHYPFYGALGAVMLNKLFFRPGPKLILHYHMDNRAAGLKGSVFYLYRILALPLLARLADAITCASLDYVKHSDLKNYYRSRPEKFRQIAFGVNLGMFKPGSPAKETSVKKLLFVGGLDRAHYFKGLENLIKALAEVRADQAFSQTILNVVGRGGLLAYYKKLVNNLGLSGSVFFQPSVSDNELVEYYNNSSALVLPSINRSEAFGLVLLEAMASGVPVIASNLPGVRSVFKNGRQGLLAKPGDINDLVEKIKLILSHPGKAESMGKAGRALAEEKYSWQSVAKKLDMIYHQVKYKPEN